MKRLREALSRNPKKPRNNEATIPCPASTSRPIRPTSGSTVSVADSGSGTGAETDSPTSRLGIVQTLPTTEGQQLSSVAKTTPPVESKEKFGMFYFTSKTPSPEQTIDLIAIHGLGGHYNETWMDRNTNMNWLRDFLPDQIQTLRIMSWGYNSAVLGSSSVGYVTTFAQSLLQDLKVCRSTKAHEQRPLIFVCHSLGGIVFKKMLVLAHERAKFHQATLKSIKGVLFLGTPHAGADLASMMKWLASIAKVASLGQTNSQLVKALQSQGNDLLEISESFVDRGDQLLRIYSFFEQEKLYGSIIVERGSARIGVPNEELIPMDCSHSTICKFPGPENRQYERVVSKLQQLVEEIDQPNEAVLDPAVQTEIIKSLEKYGYNPRQDRISDVSEDYQSPLDWIWKLKKDEGPGFVDWIESGSGIFWFSGKPGAGKSTLMKHVYENEQLDVHLQSRGERVEKLSFWFHEQGEPNERTFLGFLRSFLCQLLEKFPKLASVVQSIYRAIQARSADDSAKKLDWNEDDTKLALRAISRQELVNGNMCMFIDGLDECDGGRINRDDIDYIMNLCNWKGISTRICIASRPELAIEQRLYKYSKIRVHDWTSSDIAKYVSKDLKTSFLHINPDGLTSNNHRLMTYLVDEVVGRAEGVFLWAKLVVRDLKSGIEDYEEETNLKQRLQSLPEGINSLYGAIFAKIPSEDLRHAVNYFQILSHANRNYNGMTLLDYSFIEEGPQKALDRPFAAIPIEEQVDRCRKTRGRIMRRTRNLLYDSKPTATSSPPTAEQETLLEMQVYFVHRTLPEYMESTLWEPIVQRASQNISIDLHLSLLALELSRFKTSPSRWKIPIIMRMAPAEPITNLIQHMEMANSTHSVFLESMAADLKRNFPNWTEFFGLPKDWGCDLPCILAYNYCEHNLKELLEQKRVDQSLFPHLLVHYCLSSRTPNGFRALLDHGCRLEDQFLGRSSWEFLIWNLCVRMSRPVSGPHPSILDICRMFLENNADPNIVISEISPGNFPLDMRSSMEKTANMHAFPCYPLHMIIPSRIVASCLHDVFLTMKTFLQWGARLDAKDGDGQTVLDTATRCLGQQYGYAVEFDFAPILLQLQRECAIAQETKVGSVADIDNPSTILDSLYAIQEGYNQSKEKAPWKQVEQGLRSLLAKLKQEGCDYVREGGNKLPEPQAFDESDNSIDHRWYDSGDDIASMDEGHTSV